MNKRFFRKGAELVTDGAACRLIRQVGGGAWTAEALDTGKFTTIPEGKLYRLYRVGKVTLATPTESDPSVRRLLVSGISRDNPEWEMAKVRRAFVLAYDEALTPRSATAESAFP